MTIDALGTKGGAARGYKRIDVFYDISGIISPQSCGNQNLGLVGLVDWSLDLCCWTWASSPTGSSSTM